MDKINVMERSVLIDYAKLRKLAESHHKLLEGLKYMVEVAKHTDYDTIRINRIIMEAEKE